MKFTTMMVNTSGSPMSSAATPMTAATMADMMVRPCP